MQAADQGPVGKITFHQPEPEKQQPKFKDVAPGYNMEYAKAILIGLMRRGQVYEGTVTDKVKEARHARNKRAKRARKLNR